MKLTLRSDNSLIQGYDLPQADLYTLWRSERRRVLVRSCRSLAGMAVLCLPLMLLNAPLLSVRHKADIRLKREQAVMKETEQRLNRLTRDRTAEAVQQSHTKRYLESRQRRSVLTSFLARMQASIPAGVYLERISLDMSVAPEHLTLNGGAENVHALSEFRAVLARFPMLRKATLIETSSAPELGAQVVLFEFQCSGDGSLCSPDAPMPGQNAPKQGGRS